MGKFSVIKIRSQVYNKCQIFHENQQGIDSSQLKSKHRRYQIFQTSLYFIILLLFLQNKQMEIARPNSSLAQKLELLKTLRSGKLQQSQKILANLSATARTNPALYSKFHAFLSEHRKEIEEIENDDKEQEAKVILVQGSDNSWVTDDSVSLSSEEEKVEYNQSSQQENENERKLMKNVTNTKSTILLNQNKDVKRPFLVQTKLKETKGHTSSLLKRGGSVTKLDFENKSLMTTLSKSNLLTKQLPKQASRPYFPPINGTKSTLKLQK